MVVGSEVVDVLRAFHDVWRVNINHNSLCVFDALKQLEGIAVQDSHITQPPMPIGDRFDDGQPSLGCVATVLSEPQADPLVVLFVPATPLRPYQLQTRKSSARSISGSSSAGLFPRSRYRCAASVNRSSCITIRDARPYSSIAVFSHLRTRQRLMRSP